MAQSCPAHQLISSAHCCKHKACFQALSPQCAAEKLGGGQVGIGGDAGEGVPECETWGEGRKRGTVAWQERK